MDCPRRRIGITRRQFHALAASGAAALALPGCAHAEAPADPAAAAAGLAYAGGGATPLAVAAVPRGAAAEATERAVRAVAQAATDFAWLSRGDTVVIKPASNSANPHPATTDPVAVNAMVKLLFEKGAGRVIVADMSGVQFVRFSQDRLRGSTRAIMEANGLARAAADAGAEVQAFEEAGWDGFFAEPVPVSGAWTGPLWLPNVLREADHVVLMPRCSRHLLAGSTLGLKTAVGWWRHDSRLEYHRDAGTFSEKTADANLAPTLVAKQRLVLTSAPRVLTTFGPDDGHVHEPDTGIVFASPSVVAHDMLSLAWLVRAREEIPAGLRSGVVDDPNTNEIFVNFSNRIVTTWLGGLGQALRAQWLRRYDIPSLWHDRVLRRAFANAGGVPRVELADADGSLPPALRDALAGAVALPG
jgi:uncharacterized protein (DUF362 family)